MLTQRTVPGWRSRACLPFLPFLVLLAGCVLHDLRRNLQELDTYGVLRGTVSVDPPSDATIVVIVYGGQPGADHVIDSFTLPEPGVFYFVVPAGTYHLAAFEDLDGNFAYDPAHDRAVSYGGGASVTVNGGQTLAGLDLALNPATAAPLGLAFTLPEAGRRSARLPTINVGTVTTLDDPRFAEANARKGLWQPIEFMFDVGAGIYFLQPYDDQKIPVLFVHGALGNPDNWRSLIAGLDRRRFQPWVAYYPTAMPLDLLGTGLDRWMQRLYATYRFPRLLVVAHSMGGLVARAFINSALQHSEGGVADSLRLFVTLSTPWQGQASAALGAEHSPTVAPSWYDMAPDSVFLQSLQAKPLPATIPHYLLFSYGGGSRLSEEANDGTVSLASELDLRAQREAIEVRGFDESHDGILSSPDAAALVNAALAAAAD